MQPQNDIEMKNRFDDLKLLKYKHELTKDN